MEAGSESPRSIRSYHKGGSGTLTGGGIQKIYSGSNIPVSFFFYSSLFSFLFPQGELHLKVSFVAHFSIFSFAFLGECGNTQLCVEWVPSGGSFHCVSNSWEWRWLLVLGKERREGNVSSHSFFLLISSRRHHNSHRTWRMTAIKSMRLSTQN